MIKKIGFLSLWIGLTSYAFIFAPPEQPDTFKLIINLFTGKWDGINPLIVVLFNLMGVWPLVYAAVLLIDGQGQKIRAWPFAIASMAVGAFAILPYLAFRESNIQFTGHKNWLLKIVDSQLFGYLLLILAIGLISYSFFFEPSWSDFIYQWQTNRFIHVMTIDFILLSLLFPYLLADDMKRRSLDNPQTFLLIGIIPLIGPIVYLCVRPTLKEQILIDSN